MENITKLVLKHGATTHCYYNTIEGAIANYISSLNDEELKTYQKNNCSLSIDTFNDKDFFCVESSESGLCATCEFEDLKNYDEWYYDIPKNKIVYNSDIAYYEFGENDEEIQEQKRSEEAKKEEEEKQELEEQLKQLEEKGKKNLLKENLKEWVSEEVIGGLALSDTFVKCYRNNEKIMLRLIKNDKHLAELVFENPEDYNDFINENIDDETWYSNKAEVVKILIQAIEDKS